MLQAGQRSSGKQQQVSRTSRVWDAKQSGDEAQSRLRRHVQGGLHHIVVVMRSLPYHRCRALACWPVRHRVHITLVLDAGILVSPTAVDWDDLQPHTQ